MSDSNMLTTYSWAAGLFQQELPSSLMVIPITEPIIPEIRELVTSKSLIKVIYVLGAVKKLDNKNA